LYKSVYGANYFTKKIKSRVYHVFSSWNFDVAYSVIKNKPGKIVFDDYDVLAGMVSEEFLNSHYPSQLKKEKYCLENADALCCRSLETQFAKHNLKYNIKGERIFFPEYLWNNPIKNNNEVSKQQSIVYIGNYSKAVAEIALSIKDLNWNLEIFSSIKPPFSEEEKLENLIINKPLNSLDLIKELTKYKYAMQLPGCIIDVTSNIYTDYKYRYAAAGKIFDYLEAGLNVFIDDEEFQKWILKRYNAAIELEKNNSLNDLTKKISNIALTNNSKNINFNDLSKITMDNQIIRLENLYKKLNQ